MDRMITTESKAREFKEIKIPEMWVGFTKDNFARWMAPKDPSMDKCPFSFISESDDKCVDVKVFVEKTAYQKAVDSLKNISKFEYCDEERGKSGFTAEALNAQKTLKELGEL